MRPFKFFIILFFAVGHLSAQADYNTVISSLKKDRINLLKNGISKDSCRSYLLTKFENEIFPFWVGTRWDYNGYSNVPGADMLIACGYFVSTTLKHMGFNWNRYDLAKMYSRDIVQQTCGNIKEYTTIDTMITAVKSSSDNLYIVGLDNHVGFILKKGTSCWFIHSNYIGLKGPDKEIPQESTALKNSNRYVLGEFLTDTNIDKWLHATPFSFN